METKVWENSFSKEDVEVLMGRALNEVEWESVVDALYNDDDLYNQTAAKVLEIATGEVGNWSE
jgi:adenosine/AMP kinase